MKLRSIKIVGAYKSIVGTEEKPFTYVFESGVQDLSPLCLVGPNGSGKSNFIELIADIFCYVERSLSKQYKFNKKLNYTFEISYWLTRNNKTFEVRLSSGEDGPIIEMNTPRGFERVTTHGEYDFEPLDAEYLYYLPDNVFAYSSGQNQGLSTVFSKLQFSYFDTLKKQSLYHNRHYARIGEKSINEKSNQVQIEEFMSQTFEENPFLYRKPEVYEFEVPLVEITPKTPSCLYSDNYLNQLIFISLVTQQNSAFNNFLKENIKIESVISFELDLRLKEFRELGEVKFEVERLIRLSSNDSKFNKETLNGLLEFKCNSHFFSKIESEYTENSDFFNKLIMLTLMAAKRWSTDEKKVLKQSMFERNVAHVSGGYSPLRVINTKVKLGTSEGSTLYDRLSDGEHQLIQIIAALILFEDKQTLFILDEPESHFNPEWRIEFVSLIDKYVNTENIDLMISTHSPFILSACEKDRVLSFKRNDDSNVCIRNVDVQTYGASFDSLLTSVFDLDVLISNKPLNEIKEKLLAFDEGNVSAEETLRKIKAYGQSFELNYRRNQLEMDADHQGVE